LEENSMLKFGKTIGIVALVTVLTVAGLAVFSQVQPAAAAEAQGDMPHGGGGRGGLCGTAGEEAAAKALGITTDELTTQLRSGKTLSDLATTAGVDVQTVKDAVNAACQAATKTAIEQGVTDGTLTREKADWLLEGLDKGYWGAGSDGGPGFGPHGFEFGGGRPAGDGANRPPKPTTTPNATGGGA
jgi:hypothetical protein